MSGLAVALLAVAAALGFWMVYRTRRLRRDAEQRETRMLEALFAARHAGDAAAQVDVDGIFGTEKAEVSPADIDAVLRAAGVQGGRSLQASPGAATQDAPVPSPAARSPDAGPAAAPAAAALPAVRDLVQVFYEARGFRAVLVDPSARPVEQVFEHKSDPGRSYAFVPVDGDLSRDAVPPIIEAARRIGQLRVLIACEGRVAAPLADALLAQGVRAIDREAMEAPLARIDAAIAGRIRAGAARRSARRCAS
jgi:hypothetical protein